MEEPSSIEKITIVNSKKINTIRDEDFGEGVSLLFKDTIVICFYGEDKDSQYVLQKFVSAADISEGINFGVVNLDHDRDIKKRFLDINDEDHPHHWVRYTDSPYILTYRLGFPQAFYNGEFRIETLKFYFENMSHLKGHKEEKVENIKIKIDKNMYLRTAYE